MERKLLSRESCYSEMVMEEASRRGRWSRLVGSANQVVIDLGWQGSGEEGGEEQLGGRRISSGGDEAARRCGYLRAGLAR
jgi:hypothetical protein